MLRFETYRVTGVEALSIHLYRLATGAIFSALLKEKKKCSSEKTGT